MLRQGGVSDSEREQKDRKIKDLEQRVDELSQQLEYLTRQLFGKKSEKGIPDHPDQLDLFDDEIDCSEQDSEDAGEEVEEDAGKTKTRAKSKRTQKSRLPENLPIEETVIEPEEVLANPDAWKQIGNSETTDRLAYEPPRIYIKRITRPKYVRIKCPEDEVNAPIIAGLPDQFIEKGLLDYTFAAHIVMSKYGDHLPLDRQSKINRERYDIDISKQTMCNTVGAVADWLRLVVEEMSRATFDSGYVQGDETPIKYLEPGTGKAQQGYLWTIHSPGGDTVYHWRDGRSTDCLRSIVPAGFRGIIQCDGYRAYPKLASERGGIDLCSCMAHIRRKFHEAAEQGQDKVFNRWILHQIQMLYRIEAELREAEASPGQRFITRQSQSCMIFKRIERVLTKMYETRRFLPQSLTGKAISYALNQLRNLKIWLKDGRVEIDNNLVENKIRPTKLGAKNWLFIGAKKAGWRSAVIYSIITSCRNHGIEPYAYLTDVLKRLPSMKITEISKIIPSNWRPLAT